MPRPPTNPNGTPMTNDQRSFLIILSAHALGSLGFGLSLLAISLGWLIPVNLTRNSDIQIPTKSPVGKSRRRSSTSQTLRVVSAPIVLDPILSRRSREYFDKRVYFVDSQRSHVQRRQTLPSDHKHNELTTPHQDSFYVLDPPLASISSSTSPRSSTSTLVTTPASSPPNTEVPLLPNTALGLIENPDAMTPLSQNSTRVPRIRNVFHRKRHSDVTASVGQSVPSTSSLSRSSSTRSRSSWSFGRPRTPDDKSAGGDSVTSAPATRLSFARRISGSRGSRPSTPTNQPSPTGSDAQLPSDTPLPSTSAFFRKSERRSAPRRRTSPYEAPYFAEPPTSISEIYLRNLPRFGDTSASSSTGSLGADEFGRGRLQKPDHSQTSVDHVGRPTHKSQSTSEGHLTF